MRVKDQHTQVRPRFDGLALAGSGVALAGWVAVPGSRIVAVLLLVAALLQTIRLARWAGDAAAGAPAPANPTALEGLDAASLDRLQAHPETLDTLALQAPMAQDKLQAWIDLWSRVKAA